MFIVGIVAAVIGITIFHVALGRTLRANPHRRIPAGRNPGEVPRGSTEMRAFAVGLIVLGAVLVSTAGWQWTAMVVAAGPVAALVVLAIHNRRVGRESPSSTRG